MDSLIAELEAATEGSRELDGKIALSLGWVKHHKGWAHWTTPEGLENRHVPFFSQNLDAALTLVPDTACNHQLFSFGGHGVEIDGFPKTAWAFGFSDTAQLMGKRAAKEEIERMSSAVRWGEWAGPPRIIMERAIAEHFIEFNCRCAATPALAVCIAARKARQAMEQAA